MTEIQDYNLIYIPIWCYFYPALKGCTDIQAIFTFQYGATSTEQRYYNTIEVLNLHSNMVLLLLTKELAAEIKKINLHSNMVLLLPFRDSKGK